MNMDGAIHLPKQPIDPDSMRGLIPFTSVCGVSTWSFVRETKYVDCLRCKGTQGFWERKGIESEIQRREDAERSKQSPIHAAAIHFLEQTIKRLDSTLIELQLDNKEHTYVFNQMSQERTDVQDSIETLQALQLVDEKATEIRSRREPLPWLTH
jgi:hypothetical protein